MTSGEQENSADVLTYRGRTWVVESEPEVVDTTEDSVLVEVWVRRGGDSEQPSKG